MLLHVPFEAVSVSPSFAVPLTCGRAVFWGAAAERANATRACHPAGHDHDRERHEPTQADLVLAHGVLLDWVPARITTTFGLSAITSGRKRISICGVVCPLMPRLIYGLPGKNWPYFLPQPSVIESPMKTTRSSLAAGAVTVALAS